MKILVFSDTHGDISRCRRVIDGTECDYVIHAGDYDGDYMRLKAAYPEKSMAGVLGNNDFNRQLTSDLLIMLGGKRIFLTHGHKYGVKYEYNYTTLKAKAESVRADVAVFGHTHMPHCEHTGRLILLNPGSIKYGATYGVIEISEKGVDARIEEVKNK